MTTCSFDRVINNRLLAEENPSGQHRRYPNFGGDWISALTPAQLSWARIVNPIFAMEAIDGI